MGIGSSTLDHSRRSSISESSAISGFSSASNKTYVHEASTLVLETVENGVKRWVYSVNFGIRCKLWLLMIQFYPPAVQAFHCAASNCTKASLATQGHQAAHLQRSHLHCQALERVSTVEESLFKFKIPCTCSEVHDSFFCPPLYS